MSKRKSDLKLAVGMGFTLVLVLLMIWMTFSLSAQMTRHSRQVTRTQEVSALIDRTRSMVTQTQIKASLDQIQFLTLDNPIQQKNLKTLRLLIAHRTIGAQTQAILSGMEQEENTQLKQHVSEWERSSRFARVLLAGLCACVMLLLLALCRELVHRLILERHLKRSHGQLSDMMESITEPYFALDSQGKFTFVSQDAEQFFGLLSHKMLGKHLSKLYPNLLGPDFESECHRALSEQTPGRFEAFSARTNAWYDVFLCPTREGLTITLRDVTERIAALKQIQDLTIAIDLQKNDLETVNAQLEALASLATLDGLTCLKNHRAFQENLAGELAKAARYDNPLSLMFLDVDHFKQFNDTFGHPAGDDVLKQVARILLRSVRDCDFVARYGGEEFVVLMPQTDGPAAAAIAERCRVAIRSAKWEHRAITASFGIASLSLEVCDAPSLIDCADKALYIAKANGRDQVVMPQFLDSLQSLSDLLSPSSI